MTTYAAFIAHVSPEPNSGCWLWTRAANRLGYGRIWHGGKVQLAHRVSLKLSGVDVPDDASVCHRCDNPNCVNPAHLYVGDQSANMRECVARGRHRCGAPDNRGERHGMAKLTAESVLAIRAASGSQRKIAKEFGVSQSAVYAIRKGIRWGHV